ncbi:MAG: hypothetical protein WB493_03525 [Anaeromyxobacteraceae bacterium]
MTAARCPSDLRLEEYLLDPDSSGVASHVDSCQACRGRIARMNAEGEEFRQYVFPATVDAVVAASARRRPSWLGILIPVAATCAAALLLFVKPMAPEAVLAAKGEVLRMQVLAATPDGVQPVANGALVPPKTPLRIQVESTVACRLKVMAADCEGHVTVLHPAAGEESTLVTKSGPAVIQAVLQGDEGPERVYAVCSKEPMPLLALAVNLKDQSTGDDDRVRRAARISGLPPGTLQATLLVEHGDEEPGEHHDAPKGESHPELPPR